MLTLALNTFTSIFDKADSISTTDGRREDNSCRAKQLHSGSITANNKGGECSHQFYAHDCFPKSAYYWVVPSSATVPGFPSELVQAAIVARQAALETSIQQTDIAVKSVLIGIYELDEAGYGRSAAQEVMLFVETNLKRRGLVEANRLLEMADTTRLSSRSLIGLIRSTARLRDCLPAWNVAYQNSRKRVSNLGKDPDSVFIGLPAVNDP